MSDNSKDLVFSILQFLHEENFMETLHMVEKESGVFFNSFYFAECITNGEWEEAENYLLGFTKVDENVHSLYMFLAIRRQKYLEALDSHDDAKAVQILKELKVLPSCIVELYASLLALPNFREHKSFSKHGDTKSARAKLVVELRRWIQSNPVFLGKLQFPNINRSRLRTLTNRSVKWQHLNCENPKPNPGVRTLFVDHSSDQPTGASVPSSVAPTLTNHMPIVLGYPPNGSHGPFQLAPVSFDPSVGGWMFGPTQMPQQANSEGLGGLGAPHISANLNQGSAVKSVDFHPSQQSCIGAPGISIDVPITINGDVQSLSNVKSRISEDLDMSKIWKLAEINEPSQLRSLKLPDSSLSSRIIKLLYTNSGASVLSLAENAVHQLWKWQSNDRNTTGKATTTVPPKRFLPSIGISMTNDISETNLQEPVPCFALTNNDCYVMSASGGKISLFNMLTFEALTTYITPPPAATSLALHPQNNNLMAIGLEDSSIQIYNVKLDEVTSTLKGHHGKVTGLAFSDALNVLVSSGVDAQVCVWNTDGWEKKGSKSLLIPSGREQNPSAQTRVQFHNDQTHMLVVHETQLAIYDASKLECIKQRVVPIESCGAITDATYSCDSQSIYASFQDGSICVFTSLLLRLRCRIYSTSYIPSNPSSRIHALTIAAHPKEPNQFAVGLTDGGVFVMEPLESEGKWGTAPPNESGQSSSAAAGQNQS